MPFSLFRSSPPAVVVRGPRYVLFVAWLLLSLPTCRREDPIRITPEIQVALEEERALLLGRSLTEPERTALRDEWFDQEILVREAYRLGLDRNDGVVRQRLLQKMRALLAEKVEEPSPEDLATYYRSHVDRYRSPELVSFDHVLLAKPAPGADGAKDRPSAEALLGSLQAGADFRKLGQRFWLGSSLTALSEADLGRVLGDDFAKAVFRLPEGQWSGPLESIRGRHLVRVTGRRATALRPFEEAAGQVREDYLESREREVLAGKIADIARRYRVEGRGQRDPTR